jgi:hypothetical protein
MPIINFRKLLMVVMLYFSIFSAYAAHPLVSEDNTTQGSGRKQIELNSDFASMSNVDTNTAAFTYTYGISNEVDIFFNIPYTWGNTSGQSAGLNDGSVGLKWRLFENQGVSFGVKPELIVASANENKGLGNGQNSYAYTLMLAYDLKPFIFLVNFGKTYNRFSRQIDLDEKRTSITRSSFAILAQLNEGITLVADFGIADSQDRAQPKKPQFAIVGAIFSISDNFEFDVGYKKGLNSAEIDRQIGFGITWRFE